MSTTVLHHNVEQLENLSFYSLYLTFFSARRDFLIFTIFYCTMTKYQTNVTLYKID